MDPSAVVYFPRKFVIKHFRGLCNVSFESALKSRLSIVMSFKAIFALVTLAVATYAAPSRQVACSAGRVASNSACCKCSTFWTTSRQTCSMVASAARKSTSLCLTFHDAIGFSPMLFREGKFGGGGADGSIMHFAQIETNFHANLGVDDIVETQRPFALKHEVSFGDLSSGLQLRGWPTSRVPHGALERHPAISRPAGSRALRPDGHYLRPHGRCWVHPERGRRPSDLAHLAAQDHVDPTIPGTPFDSTPSDFDAQFFVETLLTGTLFPGNGSNVGEVMSPLAGEIRILSDFEIARDARTACEWQSFITDHTAMVTKFERVMSKLATLGQNARELIDCSEVIPVPAAAKLAAVTLPAGRSWLMSRPRAPPRRSPSSARPPVRPPPSPRPPS
ncbi:Versatile peroxidase VPL1 [Grifola frondosa]|uniref:Versatile peroxidase VPL1 n=1 Tax=Grifola frondosa TaxID=5627 RepID=A0A1C7MWL4_GRIFR|nr:Versatile peroxidase VPL1 [Grifola frondosa]